MMTEDMPRRSNRSAENTSGSSEAVGATSSSKRQGQNAFFVRVVPLFIICTCVKILLMLPTYRSTDFDVHRNWLAITRQLPLKEWYFDDVHGTTVHTLDYPPNFAFFEWAMSHNPFVDLMIPADDRCLSLLPDADNDPSDACVVYQRFTVIVSDMVLWFGAAVACRGAFLDKSIASKNSIYPFLLIVLNPGLLWLDHIHFQYNGMLLGLLLLSLGLFMHGNHVPESSFLYDVYHLSGAVVYAILLNLKHLYLPLAPLYFTYLLGRYCMDPTTRQIKMNKLIILGAVTAVTLVAPWIPFLMHGPKEQALQILVRLFPFGRGLVHDYWAANMWALYMLAGKAVSFASRKNLHPMLPPELPDIPPSICALFLLISLLPALYVSFFQHSNRKLLQAAVYCSLCTFMLAYHVHEKAIMTAMLLLALLTGRSPVMNLVYWQISLWGLVGLFPLLFDSFELSFKLSSFAAYMAMCSYLLEIPPICHPLQVLTGATAFCVIVILEFLPIQGGMEFLPLMITSISCAVALVGCWFTTLRLLVLPSA